MATRETSLTYRWPPGNLVARIDIRQQSDGRAVAYLYADESETARPARQALRTAFRQKGWGTLSDFRDGAYALRVSGLESTKELLDVVTSIGAATPTPTVTVQDTANQDKGIFQSIKDNSLRLSGLVYMLGNAFYYMGGRAANSADDKRMALSFAAGDALLGTFGGRDDARQFRSLIGKLQQHFESTGIEVPKTASIHVEASQHGLGTGGRLKDFMHEQINPLKISAEVVGGFFAFRSGMKQNAQGQRNPYRILGGLVVMAGWAGALLTKERKPDKEKLQDAPFSERAAAYIQEKPLRLAGWAGLTFNALTFKGAWNNRTTEAGKWNFAAVGAMVSANGLYSISNKTVGGDIKTDAMVSDVYMVAAQILNKQPENIREAAIESTAQFLGERPEIRDTRPEIIQKLRAQMIIQRTSPWFENTPLPAYIPTAKKAPPYKPGRDATLAELATDQPSTTVQANGLEHAREAHATVAQL